MGEVSSRIVSEDGNVFYHIELPLFSPQEMTLLNAAKEKAVKKTGADSQGLTIDQNKQSVLLNVIGIIDNLKDGQDISQDKIQQIGELIANDVVGYSLLEPLLEDDDIEEIMVIGPKKPVYVFHRKQGMLETNVIFQNPEEIEDIANKIALRVGRTIDNRTPLLDARLADGSRVNATLSPPGVDGSTITIRKFKKDPLTIIDLIKFGTLNTEVAAFLWLMVDGYGAYQKNIIIAGGTGSGKTSTLNSLGIFIREKERVVTIEDTAELQIPISHIVRFESRAPNADGKGEIDMDALVKNTLRMRPDRLILGEVRGAETKSLFTAMNTGHNGNFASLHANNSRECMTRLTNEPMNVPPIMIPALDLVLIQSRISRGDKGSIRRIIEVTEIGGVTDDTVGLSKIYDWDPAKDDIKSTGTPSKLRQDLSKEMGINLKGINEEVEKRKLVLEHLVKGDIRGFQEVRTWVDDYYKSSDDTLKKILDSYGTTQSSDDQSQFTT